MTEPVDMPDGSNFFGLLITSLSREQIAQLYGASGCTVRKCTWIDYEVRSDWAELVIDSENPILLHGPVADVLANAERILEPLKQAGVAYSAECYDEDDNLLQEFEWPTKVQTP